jgi:hypothetical protein
MTKTLTLIATLALPSLALAAEDKPVTPDQGVAACVEFREKAVACKDVLADYFASFAPAERRASIREKVVAEIVADGSGPLEARRAKCAASQAPAPNTEADLATLHACAAKTDCNAQLACAKPVMDKMMVKRRKH